MKKIKLLLLSIIFLFLGCAKPTSPEVSPNSFYYYAYAKYSITIGDYINWSGLFFYPSDGKFSLSYQSPDFTCLGLSTYSTVGSSEYFPANDGDSVASSGTLLDPAGGCFNSITSFSIKKIGNHLSVPFYELTLGAERYLIRTNK
jgi:hypothetical protein